MIRHATLALVVLAALSPSSIAQWSFSEEARLTGAGSGTNQAYGSSVDIDGSTAVVGVPRWSTGFGGRVFVYTRNAGVWSQQAELAALDDAVNNGFGWSVDLDGDTLVIGANGATASAVAGAGAGYVFTRTGTTWTQQQKLVAFDAEQQAEFGYAATVDGDTCAFGAPQSTTNNTVYSGATYVFTRSGAVWTLQQRIAPVNGYYGARSGRALALEGNSILIGAPIYFDQANSMNQVGRVLEYARSGATWTLADEFGPGDPSTNKTFGASIARDGSRAIIGAIGDVTGTWTGAAYVFQRVGGSWTQQQKLVPQGAAGTVCYYGTSVGIEGHVLAFGGTYAASSASSSSGKVVFYDFDGATWTERLELVGSATSSSDRLGSGVAIDGDFVIAGANHANTPSGGFSGEAYVWRTTPQPTEVYCTAKTNSLGCVPAIGSSGTPSATSASPFLVSASLVRNQKLGLLFYGFAPNATPFQGGYLCVLPPTIRLPVQLSNGTALPANDCSGAYAIDFNARIQSGGDPMLVAGEDVYCQWWSRDPGAVANTGLTDAMRVRIQP